MYSRAIPMYGLARRAHDGFPHPGLTTTTKTMLLQIPGLLLLRQGLTLSVIRYGP